MYDLSNYLSTFGHFKFEFWHGMRRTAFVDFQHSKSKDRYGVVGHPLDRTKTYKL